MNAPATATNPAQRPRTSLVWEDGKKFKQEGSSSGIVVSVRIARPFPTASRIYSLQVGVERDGKIGQFVPVMIDRESTKLTSTSPEFQFDYAGELERLTASAIKYIAGQAIDDHHAKLEAAYERDLRSAQFGKAQTPRTGKTARDRAKKEGKR